MDETGTDETSQSCSIHFEDMHEEG